MTTKRTKHRAGPFNQEYLQIDPSNLQPGDEAAILGVFAALAPQGRIDRLWPHAERLGVGCDLLDAARALIDPAGTVTNMHRFDALIAKAELQIERAQNESLNVYGLAGRTARHGAKLSKTAAERNQNRRIKAEPINARLIALDDQMADDHPKFSKERRAEEIIKHHPEEVPGSPTAASLAKRIRNARK